MKRSCIQAKGDSAQLLIYEDIGEGMFGGLGAKAFRQQIDALTDVKTITVRINSDGGSVFEGVAIYNALKDHPATKNVIIDGIAASIASLIAMAGDTITIQPTAFMMIHEARGTFRGTKGSLMDAASLLESINEQMAVGYARSGKSREDILGIMAAETWYTAQGAVDAGWCTGLVKQPLKLAASLKDFDLSSFDHVPDFVKIAAENTRTDSGCMCICEPCLGNDCAGCSDVGCSCVGCNCPQKSDKAKAENLVLLSKNAENQAETLEIQQKALIASRNRELNLRLAEFS